MKYEEKRTDLVWEVINMVADSPEVSNIRHSGSNEKKKDANIIFPSIHVCTECDFKIM